MVIRTSLGFASLRAAYRSLRSQAPSASWPLAGRFGPAWLRNIDAYDFVAASRIASPSLVVVGLGLMTACIRPSDDYEVRLYSNGTELDTVLPAPEPMGGIFEYQRFRLLGSNLGFGVTQFFGDAPRADGSEFTMGYGQLSWPPDPGYDRVSNFLTPGPPLIGGSQDACATRTTVQGFLGFSEYVDAGDHLSLTAGDGTRLVFDRDPPVHPPPAGESFFSGYGGALFPFVQDHHTHPDTWRSETDWAVHFPGTILPAESTQGAIPYPLQGAVLRTPPDIEDLHVNGGLVKSPREIYKYPDGACGDEEFIDRQVVFGGPWEDGGTVVNWTPSAAGDPLTVIVRYLGESPEGECDTTADCGAGFHCRKGTCYGNDGSNSVILGEYACTAVDDGEFELPKGSMAMLNAWVDPQAVKGAVLVVARISETTAQIPDVITQNGKRVVITPMRLRATDAIYTRLSTPNVASDPYIPEDDP